MALWGLRDSFEIAGTVDVSNTIDTTTVVGTSTAFTANLEIGDMITIDSTKYKVVAIANDTYLTIDPAFTGANQTGATITGQDTPKYLRYEDGRNTFGVDTTERDANDKDAGWILRNTYTDMHGNTRDKREVLVAMSSISADAEDTVYPDAVITIVTEPASATANTAVANGAIAFTVVADVDPTSATIVYRWEEDDGGGFAELSDGGVYANTSEATLNIANTVGLDGYVYRVQLSATGVTANTVSANATLTVI
jgi:hypothetical protein